MKTLTVTSGRQRLGHWLSRAIQGEDIAFVHEGHVVALRPVKIHSEDYALQEYGLTEAEADAAGDRISKEIAEARKRGGVKPFTGKLHELRD